MRIFVLADFAGFSFVKKEDLSEILATKHKLRISHK
jgi:hypothetical protein